MTEELDSTIGDLMCVECGGAATEGSFKHPYCKDCFRKVFDNDINKYFAYLERTH